MSKSSHLELNAKTNIRQPKKLNTLTLKEIGERLNERSNIQAYWNCALAICKTAKYSDTICSF